jgi:hypothetical protein
MVVDAHRSCYQCRQQYYPDLFILTGKSNGLNSSRSFSSLCSLFIGSHKAGCWLEHGGNFNLISLDNILHFFVNITMLFLKYSLRCIVTLS